MTDKTTEEMAKEIKPLEKQFQKKGFSYEQMYAGTEGYIYSKMSGGRIHSYEAFQHKVNTYYNCVSFPGDEAFGTWAWDCRSLSDAQDRLGIKIMPVDLD